MRKAGGSIGRVWGRVEPPDEALRTEFGRKKPVFSANPISHNGKKLENLSVGTPCPQGGTCGLRPVELRSLYEELSEVPDFRRAQGRKHQTATVLAIYLLARLAGLHGGKAAAA